MGYSFQRRLKQTVTSATLFCFGSNLLVGNLVVRPVNEYAELQTEPVIDNCLLESALLPSSPYLTYDLQSAFYSIFLSVSIPHPSCWPSSFRPKILQRLHWILSVDTIVERENFNSYWWTCRQEETGSPRPPEWRAPGEIIASEGFIWQAATRTWWLNRAS